MRLVHALPIHAPGVGRTRVPIFFFTLTSTFQFLDKLAVVTRVIPSPPPGSCLQFLLRIRFSNPLVR